MRVGKAALAAASCLCLAVCLAACSGGGGGGTPVTTANNNGAGSNTNTGSTNTGGTSTGTSGSSSDTSGSTSSGNTSSGGTTGTGTTGSGSTGSTATVSISGSNAPSIGSNAPNLATSTTPSMRTTPPVGTVFSLRQTAITSSPTKVAASNVTDATATFQGFTTISGFPYPTFEIKVPSMSLDVPNAVGIGNTQTLANGDQITLSSRNLDYTFTAQWGYLPSGSNTYLMHAAVGGFETPVSGLPTSGTALYIGNAAGGTAQGGSVSGRMHTPDNGTSIGTGVSGVANLNINFAGGTVTGTLANMQAGTTPWNTVNLTGTMSGAVMQGTTSTSGAPAGAGALGFSSAAVGTFGGALYGPNASEVGAVWSLAEPTADGGKQVMGAFMATHQ